MKILVVVAIVVAAVYAAPRLRRSARNEYKMCVPEDLLPLCQQMSLQQTKSPARIVCISARDRFQCIEKIKKRVADFLTVDPEDMYLAAKTPDQDFAVFEEIRTREEPEAEFRYEAVAVIRKDLNISGVEGLKGLNSCHTGVGRNVGYKIPLTKLKQKGIIGPLNLPDLSPRENELKAFSELFSKACIVGKWAADPKINLEWKKKYKNLCALCEKPDVCDYPDEFSGYEGALKCLAHNGGQVAWTKVIYVRKFFGLPVGVTPAKPTNENPDLYAYLCPDGSRVPVTGQPCRWAARPWQGYLANADVIKTVDELRRKIENLDSVGMKNHADWLEKVLLLNDKTVAKENKVIPPGDYLDKANYTDVIERDYGPPYKTVRLCVTSSDESEKCDSLSKSAFSRDVRPRFGCVEEKTVEDCMKTTRDNGADVIAIDAEFAEKARRDYNLKPIVAERYGNGTSVVVVKKTSNFKAFSDLRDTELCRSVSQDDILYTLVKQNLIDKAKYPYSLSDFFSSTCLSGSKDQCKFETNDSGALKCLVEGGGDVAIVDQKTVAGNTDDSLELLCPQGGWQPLEKVDSCSLVREPPRVVVTSRSKTDSEVDEIRNLLLSASSLYTERPDLFKMFGTFNGKKNLIFKDAATGLVSVSEGNEVQKE